MNCTVKGCDRPINCRSMCQKHYCYYLRNGMLKKLKDNDKVSMSRLPEYRTYRDMLNRCNNPNLKIYTYYGARGIKVCDRWSGKMGFPNFYEDMGSKPTPKHSIDRIDFNGNYEPSNCRWATWHEQANNRSNNTKYIGILERHNAFNTVYLVTLIHDRKVVFRKTCYSLNQAILERKTAVKKFLSQK